MSLLLDKSSQFPPLQLPIPSSRTVSDSDLAKAQHLAIGTKFLVQVVSPVPPNLVPEGAAIETLNHLSNQMYTYGLECTVPNVRQLYDHPLFAWHDILYMFHGRDLGKALSNPDTFKFKEQRDLYAHSSIPFPNVKFSSRDVRNVKCPNVYYLLLALGFIDFATLYDNGKREAKFDSDATRFGKLLQPRLVHLSQTIQPDAKIATIGYLDSLPVNPIPSIPDLSVSHPLNTPGFNPNIQYSF
jgi:hypothetical protein